VGYRDVHREWEVKGTARNGVRVALASLNQPVMLEKWLQESMREQPYHALGAVALSSFVSGRVRVQENDTLVAATGKSSRDEECNVKRG
jgi:hypothetical protein